MSQTALATTTQPILTQHGARVASQAAEQYASEIGVPMSIAIVDAHTHLLSFTRMDGAKMTSINTAMDMAFTAAGNRLPTSAYGENPYPWSPTPGTTFTPSTRYCTIGGGIPIFSPDGSGDLLGAIGCSTGTSLQDEAAAKAGRDAVLDLITREKEDEERRVELERQAVLDLWREKEEEVDALREELERGTKRLRVDECALGWSHAARACLSTKTESLSGQSGVYMVGTPSEEEDSFGREGRM